MWSYLNIKLACGDQLNEIMNLHDKPLQIVENFGVAPLFFPSNDWKMDSTFVGHAGSSSTYFSPIDEAMLEYLQPEQIPSRPVLQKYLQYAPRHTLLPEGEQLSLIHI